MKKVYVKPEAEILSLILNEAITDADDGDYIPGLEGSSGYEEW